MQFEVVIPNHDPHLQCFLEVATSVVWALGELGHEAKLSQGAPSTLARPIYFGLPLGPLPHEAILFNGEQVSDQSIWGARRLDSIYRRHVVWEYSAVNATRYAKYGLDEPAVVRPGYCPRLEHWCDRLDKETARAPKEYDIAFFGSHNPRREQILRGIEQAGLKLLRVPFGVYGAPRDALLARARLCLNVHFYENAIFESVRCSYLIHNRVPILSEVDPENSCMAWGVARAQYGDLVEHAQSLLGNESALNGLALLQHHDLQQISLKDDVGAAVERLEHTPKAFADTVTIRPGSEPPELTLCMIVKDEALVIERCLASVKPFLKRWSILDTGSTDGTQDIIRKFMADLPGVLHERPWKEYDGSRTEAMELASQVCDKQGWLMLIDADEIFTVQGALTLPDEEHFDCYNAWLTRCQGCNKWGRSAFVRASKGWHYILPRHEGLYGRGGNKPTYPHPIPNITILSTSDGSRARRDAYERYMEDAQVLEKWLASNPHHPVRARAQYYLAQSYRDAATGKTPPDPEALRKALQAYLLRTAMGGEEQEVQSAHQWAAECMRKLGFPWEMEMKQHLAAYQQRPSRAEPIFHIGEHYRQAGQYHLAELFLRKAAAIPPTGDTYQDVNRSIYAWKAKEELAVAVSWLGNWAEAKKLFREVLKQDLAAHDRLRIEQNYQESLKRVPD